jgi:starvation-inducible DNA-binding protein
MTKIRPVPPTLRKLAISLLNHTVVELFDLFVCIKHADWNVRGASFIGLHRFLAEFAWRILDYMDVAAEQAISLGGTVEGAVRAGSKHLPLKQSDVPHPIGGISYWLQELAKVNATYSEHARAAAGKMTEAGEPGTADLLTAIARDLAQPFWMLEAHMDQQ